MGAALWQLSPPCSAVPQLSTVPLRPARILPPGASAPAGWAPAVRLAPILPLPCPGAPVQRPIHTAISVVAGGPRAKIKTDVFSNRIAD